MINQLKLVDGTTVEIPENKKLAAKFLATTLLNSGYAPGSIRGTDSRVDWKSLIDGILLRDSISSTHLRPLMQASLEVIMREPIEPIMTISNLFTKVIAKGMDTRVLSGALGAVYAEDVDEGSAYPEVNFNAGGGIQTAVVGKSGIQASFTDEALRYTTWDIMAINLRQMKAALIRHKENKAVGFLRELGITLFDNLTPASSLFGVTTGRAIDGTANGSVTMDDLFKAIAQGQEQGYPFNIMLVNPQMFYLWVQDPVLRAFAMNAGGGAWFNQFSGNSGPLDPWSNGALGASGPSLGNQVIPTGAASGETATGIAGREHGMTSVPSIPSIFPSPVMVMPSSFVPFDADTGLTDIYLLSAGNVGIQLVDEEVTQVEWRDENTETVKVKLRERYGFHVAIEGMGIGVLKNIPLVRNYFTGEVTAMIQDLEAIPSTTPIDL